MIIVMRTFVTLYLRIRIFRGNDCHLSSEPGYSSPVSPPSTFFAINLWFYICLNSTICSFWMIYFHIYLYFWWHNNFISVFLTNYILLIWTAFQSFEATNILSHLFFYYFTCIEQHFRWPFAFKIHLNWLTYFLSEPSCHSGNSLCFYFFICFWDDMMISMCSSA